MMLDRTRYNPEPSRRRRAPPGYEMYGVDWDRLTPTQTAIVCAFADALREIRVAVASRMSTPSIGLPVSGPSGQSI
jgi:hypothetical protein